MLEFKSRLIGYLEGSIGREISYRSISPAVFRHLEIRDLAIYETHRDGSPVLTVRKLRVTYNLFRLFGDDPLSALSEIRFENTSVEIDIEKDTDLLDLFGDLLPYGRIHGFRRRRSRASVSGYSMILL